MTTNATGKSFAERVFHAVLYEAVAIMLCAPVAAWWLSITLWQAALLDGALLLFFLPYTVAFNWVYDVLRERRVARALVR